MASRAATEWRYEKLTWPEINDAVEVGKVCVLPCSAVEQHGPHLPLDVDVICPTEIARGAGRTIPEKMLLLPTHCYGYTGHVMDFPGTINTHFEHFMDGVLDITKSLAYHGFKKIILLNGHGSNWPNLDLVARRTNLETDAECVPICWWGLLTVDKEFMPRWRQSKSSNWSDSSPGSRTGPRISAGTGTAPRQPCRSPGAKGRSGREMEGVEGIGFSAPRLSPWSVFRQNGSDIDAQ
jgi:hypothetical protein